MARGFGKQANQTVKADSVSRENPPKTVIQGKDLRSGKK